MKSVSQNAEVGVIVGRFQSPSLHDGYLEVINAVKAAHPRVIIYLGLSPLKFTKYNPLDYSSRRAMIEERFPDVEVYYIDDVGDNEKWSRKLDELINKAVGPQLKVVLYGSRDSFINSYIGRFPTIELVPSKYVSASDFRRAAGIKAKKTEDFRTGIVHVVENQYPKVDCCVDLGIVDYDKKQMLLARKPGQELLVFIGGHIDPKDKSAEEAAVREGKEETDLDLTVAGYVGSTLIDEWAYRREIDKLMTFFYVMRYAGGTPVAKDDIAFVCWKKFGEISEGDVMPKHRPLLLMLNDYFNNEILRLA